MKLKNQHLLETCNEEEEEEEEEEEV